jgi:hypothetical protein
MAATKATTKKTPKLLEAGWRKPSVRRFVIFASFALNIAFVVLLLTISTTNKLDGVFMPVALERYCSTANDDKFQKEDAQLKALRGYVCDRPDAHQYFHGGYKDYLKSLDIPVKD